MQDIEDPAFIRARAQHYRELAEAAEEPELAKQYCEIAEAFEHEAKRQEGWRRPRPRRVPSVPGQKRKVSRGA